jgi:beta-glucosidase
MKSTAELILPAIRWDPRNGFEPAKQAVEEALALGVGGFIIFGGEKEAVRKLTGDLAAAAPHPLLIASDLERGAGQQVRGLTSLPPLMALARLGEKVVREAARITAREARDVGINWVLAPVVDLDVEPANPIVQTRSFGDDPGRVGALARAWIESCQAEGALACAKHFPGHGRTTSDSHAELPVVAADRASLEADLGPFRDAIAAGVASVMTAHVAYPALDPSGVPATYSARILTELLRREMGYDGLVVTDALIMKGALQQTTEAEGAVRALAAGCDLLLYPKDVAGVVAAIDAAIDAGTLPASHLTEAVARRRAAAGRARSAAGSEAKPPAPSPMARDSLLVLRGAVQRLRGPLSVHVVDDDVGLPVPLPPRSAFTNALKERGIEIGPGGERVVILFADVKAGKRSGMLKPFVVHQLEAHLATPATVVLFGHPRHAARIPGEQPVLCAWSGDEVMQRAAAHFLLDA